MGGIVGFGINCVLTRCGTEGGTIEGFSETGGIAGQLYKFFSADQIYAGNVCICCYKTCGGLIGQTQSYPNSSVLPSNSLQISNSYSSGIIVSKLIGGNIFGAINIPSQKVQLIELYSSSLLYFSGNAWVSSAQITTNVFILNNTYSSFPCVGSLAIDCNNERVSSQVELSTRRPTTLFDQSIWIGCRLRCE